MNKKYHAQKNKICTGCRVIAVKIHLYHSSKIAKARPHNVEWPEHTSVQSSGPWVELESSIAWPMYIHQSLNCEPGHYEKY